MGRLKNYQITRTTLLPAATVVYWKINALPAGNLPEITVLPLCPTKQKLVPYRILYCA